MVVAGPLAGLRVVDVCDDAGRFATKLLAESGASVVRIGQGSHGPAMSAEDAAARGGLLDWWYDGGNPLPNAPYVHDGNSKPPKELTSEIEEMLGKVPGSGCLLIGDKGKLFSPDDYGAKFFIKLSDEKEYIDGTKHEAVKDIPQTIPRNTLDSDTDKRHHLEWISAIKGGPAPYSNFDIAAYLTEIILLGDVAMRTGQIPPTINLETPDPECDLDYVPDVGRKKAIEHAICNCIAFGSKNSALVLRYCA